MRPENVGPGEDYPRISTSKHDVLDGTDIIKNLKIYWVKLLNFILDKFEKILVSFMANRVWPKNKRSSIRTEDRRKTATNLLARLQFSRTTTPAEST